MAHHIYSHTIHIFPTKIRALKLGCPHKKEIKAQMSGAQPFPPAGQMGSAQSFCRLDPASGPYPASRESAVGTIRPYEGGKWVAYSQPGSTGRNGHVLAP